MRIEVKGCVVLFVTAILTATSADAQRRIYVNEYLNIGVGARGLAMAGAVSSSTDDVTASYWNPAGLMRIKEDYQVGLMHAEYFAGNAKYDYGAVAIPLKRKNRALAISGMRFAIDDIPNTIDYVQPDGSFDESKLKSLTAGDYAFLVSYAQGLKWLSKKGFSTAIGANVKVIYRHLGSLASAWGGGVDVGLQSSGKGWQFGIMLKDITTTYTSWNFNLSEKDKQVFGETGNEIPIRSYEVMNPRINVGIARSLLKPGKAIGLMVEVDADITTDGRRNTLVASNDFSLDAHAGLEGNYKNVIFLRGGIGNIQRVLDDRDTTNNEKYTLFQPAVGLGLKLGSLMVDYAYTSLQTQSSPLYSHIISLRLDLKKLNRNNPTIDIAPNATNLPEDNGRKNQ